jgi:hypothetical protein
MEFAVTEKNGVTKLIWSTFNTDIIISVSLNKDQKQYYAMQFISLPCYKYFKIKHMRFRNT